jgi:hypothetical protein
MVFLFGLLKQKRIDEKLDYDEERKKDGNNDAC